MNKARKTGSTLLMAALLIGMFSAAPAGAGAQSPSAYRFKVTSKRSLAYVGIFFPESSDAATTAAKLLYDGLKNKKPEIVKQARDLYSTLIPKENFGGEYTAIQWFCDYYLAGKAERKAMIQDPFVAYTCHFFGDHNYAILKEYLQRQYRLRAFAEDPEKAADRTLFLQDMMTSNNPRRPEWEKTDEIIGLLDIKKGDVVADIGCGSGFYTGKLAKLVGSEGHVYAADIVDEMLNFVKKCMKSMNIKNVSVVTSTISDCGLKDKVDVAFMCSLYHLLYSCSIEQYRRAYIQSIKQAIKPGGRFIVVDNSPVEGDALSYHGSFVSKDLVIAQLQHNGFELEKYCQIIPQRYVLIFRLVDPMAAPPIASTPMAIKVNSSSESEITVDTENSQVHIGSLDSFDITDGGVAAAKLVLKALEKNDVASARKALDIYSGLIPKENYGGEYTALQWFMEKMVATPERQREMLKDPMDNAYFHYFADKKFSTLMEYIKRKYHIKKIPKEDPELGHTRRGVLEDFILFNNPKRESWEHTSKIMKLLPIKQGDKILDIGCGPGYYTYKFSKLVGDTGRIYALDLKQEHLDFLKGFLASQKIYNVSVILSKVDDVCVKDKADMAYFCSLYHIIYAVDQEKERSDFIASVKNALKPDGRLVVVDNGPVENTVLPYHGPYIGKELIISQLAQYGFELVQYEQIIPQRYMLVFKMKK
jgi:ubiquinone/menaquinone biosynthesis C-methylase UbiE